MKKEIKAFRVETRNSVHSLSAINYVSTIYVGFCDSEDNRLNDYTKKFEARWLRSEPNKIILSCETEVLLDLRVKLPDLFSFIYTGLTNGLTMLEFIKYLEANNFKDLTPYEKELVNPSYVRNSLTHYSLEEVTEALMLASKGLAIVADHKLEDLQVYPPKYWDLHSVNESTSNGWCGTQELSSKLEEIAKDINKVYISGRKHV